MGNPKIILFDIETSPLITATFSLYPDSIHHTNILQDWFIISAAWKELGSKSVKATSINDFKRKSDDDDLGVVTVLRAVFEDADMIIGHNSDKFDIKKLNARLMFHGLDPLPKVQSIDTLKEVKKIAQFTSHRLDYLGMHLIGQGKAETSPGLWLSAMKGDRKSVKEMVEYNKIDVVRLEEFYLKLRPYMKSHPHVGVYNSDKHESCRYCGSTELVINKTRYTASGEVRLQKKCKSCHGYGTYLK